MDILHIFSMAGVANILGHHHNHGKSVVLQLDQYDRYGYGNYYENQITYDNIADLMNDAIKFNGLYDKIIIHDAVDLAPDFNRPKDVSIFFHGTTLRGMNELQLEKIKKYNCFVSTTDLLDILPDATYIPVPCDTDLFQPKKIIQNPLNNWLAINRSYQRSVIEREIKQRYDNVQYVERDRCYWMYDEMPNFLRMFKNYVDMKYTYDDPPVLLPDLSATGVQALSCGLQVWNGEGRVRHATDILEKHEAKRVTEEFEKWLE
jgi:hypothetical protein